MSGAFASVNADSDAPLVAPRAFHPVVAPSSSYPTRRPRRRTWAHCRNLEWIIVEGEFVPQEKIHTNNHIKNIEINDAQLRSGFKTRSN
jgi:hypothetical protein